MADSKRTKKMLLCRNESGAHQYLLQPSDVIAPVLYHGFWNGCGGVFMCAFDFEEAFPHLRLKPGDGPLRIKVTIKVDI